jgi:bifunctional oligoribonuclease and PAP phosphatase NrnA
MSSSPNQTTTEADLGAVVEAIRGRERFLVTTHENPDGDALGSLLAAQLALTALGKDSEMFLPGPAPLPGEYRFLPLQDLRRELPDDAAERTLVAVDAANESRLGADAAALHAAPFTINVDHHHDNSRFGDVNLVDAEASSTGDVHKVFEGVYESVQFAKLKLLARALERAQVYEGGGLIVSYLLRNDFGEVGAVEPYSEGIIDFLRAVEGADMAALIREPPRGGSPARRVSLRASHDELDVSAIARESGGGGHRQAAGFSSDESIDEITSFLRREFAAASAAAR